MATITSLGFNIKSNWDGDGVKAAVSDLQLLQEQMRRISGAALKVDVVVDTDGPNGIGAARRELDLLEQKMRRISGAALNIAVHVDDAGMDAAVLRMQALQAEARDINIKFEINEASYAATEARIALLVRDRTVNIDIDTNGMNDGIMQITNNFRTMVKGSEDFQTRATRAMVMVRLAMVAVLGAAGVLPAAITAIGAAFSVIPGVAAVALGGALLSRVESVRTAFSGLGETILGIGDRAVKPMVQPVLDAVDRIKSALMGMEPVFADTFSSAAELVRPLSDTLIAFVQRVMPGVNDMLRESVPLFNGIQEGVKNFATSISRMFSAMSGATEDFGMTWNILFTYLGRIMEAFGFSSARMAKDVNESLGDSMRSFEAFIRGALDGMEGFAAATGGVNNGLAIFRTLGDVLRIILPAWGELYAAIGGFESGLNNLGTGIATFIAGAMSSFAEVIRLAMPYLNDFAFYLGKGVEAISSLTPMVGPLVAALYGLRTVLTLIGKNPLVALVIGIVAVIGYLYDLEQRTGAVSRFFKNVWEEIGPIFQPIVDKVKELIDQFNRFGGFAELWNRTRDALNGVREGFDNLGGVGGIWDRIKSAMEPVTNVIKALVETYMPQIKGIGTSWAEAFAPFWDKIEPSVRKLGDAFESAWPRIQTVLLVIGAAIGATFGGILGVIKNVAGPVMEVLVTLFNGVVGVITSIVDVISGIIQFLSGIVGVFVNVGKAVAAIFTGNGEAFKNAMGGIWDSIKNIFGGLTNTLQGVAGIIANIWNTIVGLFKGAVQLVFGVVSGFIEGVINFFTRMWDVLVGHSIVPDMINAIIKWFKELPGKLIGMVRDFIENIIKFFVDLAIRLVQAWMDWINKIQDAWNKFSAFLRGGWDAFWQYLTDKWESFKNFIINGWNLMYDTFRNAWTTFSNFMRGGWDAMWQYLTDAWNGFRDMISNAWNTLWTGVEVVAKTVWGNITSGFTSFKDGVIETISGMVGKVKEIWETITGIFQKPVEAVKGIWNSVAGTFGLPEFAIGGEVIHRAEGGSIRGKGTGTSDDIPAMLSNGEHVWTAREVDAAGGHAQIYKMRQEVLRGGPPLYAAGGPVDLAAPPWSGEANLKPAAILARRNIKKYWPQIREIGGYRASDPYPDHPSGLALDVMTGRNPGDEIHAWLNREMNALALNYTIWQQRYQPAGGASSMMEDRGSPTQNHLDHIHALFNANGVAGIQDGGIGGSSGAALGPSPEQIAQMKAATDGIRKIIDDTNATTATKSFGLQKNKGVLNLDSKGTKSYINPYGAYAPAGDTHGAGTEKSGLGAISKMDAALAAMSSSGSFGPIGGMIPEGERRAIIEQAMALTNTPPPSTKDAWLAGMNTLIERESGWNAGARNDWDSNAAMGQNSGGLTQTIPTTFAANKVPGYDNMYGAVDNVAASINYIKRTYGSIENVQQANANMPPKGYATGTRSAGAGWSMVGEQGPELVKFSGGETVKTFDEIISTLKATTAGNVESIRTRLGAEFDTAIKKLIESNKGDANQMRAALETCVREAIATTGMKFDITGNGNTEEMIQQVVQRLTAFLQQGVGRV